MKAAAMAALLAGQGTAEIAERYAIPEGTLKSWRNRNTSVADAAAATVAPDKRAEIGTLLVDYLHANLTTLRKQNEVFSDAEWLKKQDAADLAVLHGVMTDKSIRLLEALGGAGDATP